MTVADALATLHKLDGLWAEEVACVEAEIARLEHLVNDWDDLATVLRSRAEAAEAEVARLRDGLREISLEGRSHPLSSAGKCGAIARALLAEDGAA